MHLVKQMGNKPPTIEQNSAVTQVTVVVHGEEQKENFQHGFNTIRNGRSVAYCTELL